MASIILVDINYSVALNRHWVTCSSKSRDGRIFSFFGPFLFQVICSKVLVLKFVQSLFIV